MQNAKGKRQKAKRQLLRDPQLDARVQDSI
jgi:hypothetical protein